YRERINDTCCLRHLYEPVAGENIGVDQQESKVHSTTLDSVVADDIRLSTTSSAEPDGNPTEMASPATTNQRHLAEARWCTNDPCIRIKVENRIGPKGAGYFSVSTMASVDALLGLCAGYFNTEINGTIGLYSSSGSFLVGTKRIDDVIRPDETIYLQRKQRGDECLFHTNWCHCGVSLLITGVLGITLLTLLYTFVGDSESLRVGIVIDAGSSHSTAHLFQWDAAKPKGTGQLIELDQAVSGKNAGIAKLKPSSTYVEIADILRRVKKQLDKNTPPEAVSVHLAATAGMRILKLRDPELAWEVMSAATVALAESGFKIKGAEIRDELDESIDGWIALNYNYKTFKLLKPTFGAMDLGGASLQVSVDTLNKTTATRHLKLFGTDYSVYSQSDLCFGNDQAYFRYLMMLLIENEAFKKKRFAVESPCHCNGFSTKQALSEIRGPCAQNKNLLPDISEIEENITINGKWDPDKCSEIAKKVVDEKTCTENGFVHCFKDLGQALPMDRNYVAFSGYYFIMHEAKFQSTNLTDLHKIAHSFCDKKYDEWLNTYYDGKAKFAGYGCWKINFVDQIFTNKYKFTAEGFSNVRFAEDINGIKISWPLGYMVNETNAIPREEPIAPVLSVFPLVVLIVVLLGIVTVSLIMFRAHHNADLRKVQGLMFASSI
ncbi:ectonucleoside triphosphate diphosphohydrolase 8-like, partial [Tropilaelaps mercedesae]